jgi:hypothetical protein
MLSVDERDKAKVTLTLADNLTPNPDFSTTHIKTIRTLTDQSKLP